MSLFWLVFWTFVIYGLALFFRNIIAAPISLIFRLFRSPNPDDQARSLVSGVNSLFWLFLIGALFIWLQDFWIIPAKVIGESLWTLIKLIPDLLVAALGCYANMKC